MSRRLMAVATFVIFVVLTAAGQQSQTLRDRDPDLDASKKLAADIQQANFHYGSFYLYSRLQLADAGLSESGSLPTGTSEGGLTLAVEAPQRFYYVPRKKVVLSTEFVPSYSFFGADDRKQQFNYRLRGDVHLLLNHLYLDAYARRADELQALPSDVNDLATVQEDEIGVAGEWKYSSRTSGIFSMRVRDTEYPEDAYQPDRIPGVELPIQFLDRREKNLRLTFRHRTFARTSLFVATEGSDYDFHTIDPYTSSRRYAGLGLAFEGGRTSLVAEAGPTQLDFEDARLHDYHGLTGRVTASRSHRKWVLQGGASRDLGFSVFVGNPYYVSRNVNANLDYKATGKLTLHLGSSYERDEFETEVLGAKRTDDISYTRTGFTYSRRHVRFGGDVGWYVRESTSYGGSEKGIRYAVRLSFTP